MKKMNISAEKSPQILWPTLAQHEENSSLVVMASLRNQWREEMKSRINPVQPQRKDTQLSLKFGFKSFHIKMFIMSNYNSSVFNHVEEVGNYAYVFKNNLLNGVWVS